MTNPSNGSPRVRRATLVLGVLFALSLALPALVLQPTRPAYAAAITVDTTSAAIDSFDFQCSLPEAIISANQDSNTTPINVSDCAAGSGADVITIVPSGTISFTAPNNTTGGIGPNALPVITSDITINGTGVSTTTLGSGAAAGRHFYIDNGGTLTLADLTLQGGRITGAAGTAGAGGAAGVGASVFVHDGAVLNLNNVTFFDNRAFGGPGGASGNGGQGGDFLSNPVPGGGGGGGVLEDGTGAAGGTGGTGAGPAGGTGGTGGTGVAGAGSDGSAGGDFSGGGAGGGGSSEGTGNRNGGDGANGGIGGFGGGGGGGSAGGGGFGAGVGEGGDAGDGAAGGFGGGDGGGAGGGGGPANDGATIGIGGISPQTNPAGDGGRGGAPPVSVTNADSAGGGGGGGGGGGLGAGGAIFCNSTGTINIEPSSLNRFSFNIVRGGAGGAGGVGGVSSGYGGGGGGGGSGGDAFGGALFLRSGCTYNKGAGSSVRFIDTGGAPGGGTNQCNIATPDIGGASGGAGANGGIAGNAGEAGLPTATSCDPVYDQNNPGDPTDPNPLAVELVSFTVDVGDGTATLAWETATEIGTSGFYVQRTDGDGDGDFTRVSDFLVAAGDGSVGATYSWTDDDAPDGAVYRLEELETDGDSLFYDPTDASGGDVTNSNRIFLPLVRR